MEQKIKNRMLFKILSQNYLGIALIIKKLFFAEYNACRQVGRLLVAGFLKDPEHRNLSFSEKAVIGHILPIFNPVF